MWKAFQHFKLSLDLHCFLERVHVLFAYTEGFRLPLWHLQCSAFIVFFPVLSCTDQCQVLVSVRRGKPIVLTHVKYMRCHIKIREFKRFVTSETLGFRVLELYDLNLGNVTAKVNTMSGILC